MYEFSASRLAADPGDGDDGAAVARGSVNIILTDPEPFSECLRDPEKSYRTLTGNLTEIDKIIWNALHVRISPCILVILG